MRQRDLLISGRKPPTAATFKALVNCGFLREPFGNTPNALHLHGFELAKSGLDAVRRYCAEVDAKSPKAHGDVAFISLLDDLIDLLGEPGTALLVYRKKRYMVIQNDNLDRPIAIVSRFLIWMIETQGSHASPLVKQDYPGQINSHIYTLKKPHFEITKAQS